MFAWKMIVLSLPRIQSQRYQVNIQGLEAHALWLGLSWFHVLRESLVFAASFLISSKSSPWASLVFQTASLCSPGCFRNSVCRPCWPWAQRFFCLCLLNAGIKGTCHCAWPMNFFCNPSPTVSSLLHCCLVWFWYRFSQYSPSWPPPSFSWILGWPQPAPTLREVFKHMKWEPWAPDGTLVYQHVAVLSSLVDLHWQAKANPRLQSSWYTFRAKGKPKRPFSPNSSQCHF